MGWGGWGLKTKAMQKSEKMLRERKHQQEATLELMQARKHLFSEEAYTMLRDQKGHEIYFLNKILKQIKREKKWKRNKLN